MPILITGGTGFVGSVVTEELLKKDKQKIILFDLYPKKVDFLDQFKEYIEVVKGDVQDFNTILDLCKGFEVDKILHLAAIADVDVCENNPLQACRVNVDGTYNIFEVSRRLDVEKVVFASSGAVYGKAKPPASEESPYNPGDVYSATKVMGEIIGLQYIRSYGINLIIDRCMFIYGPGMFFEEISPFGIVANAVKGKPTVFEKGGDQLYDFTFVRDTANGIILTLSSDLKKLKHRIFNISSGKGVKLYKLAEIVKKYIPEANINVGPGEADVYRTFPLDISRAKEELGYEPKVSIEDGVRELIAWLKKS